jgi:hypothetical protein
MDRRHTIGLPAIGDPCAFERWQDHHRGVVVFLIDATTQKSSYMEMLHDIGTHKDE